jgi:rhomboid family GlyGly-CTERM serine protease
VATRLRLNAWGALAAVLGLGAAAMALQAAPPAALDWRPGLASAEPWRALTAAFVHLSPLHLGANALGLALVAALGWRAGCGRREALAWALAWPLTHVALLWQPGLLRYGGLSGVLHAGVAVAVVRLLARGGAAHGGARAVGAALALGLLAKLWLERPHAVPLGNAPGWDIPVAAFAHLTGALAGVLCALVLEVTRPAPPAR